jgi:HAD superfamily hydrolase (TIGR01509 family)
MGAKKLVPTLLFDLDGTLVDTDRLHLQAYNMLLAKHGRHITIDYYKSHVMGFPNDQITQGLFPGESREQQQKFAEEKEETVRTLFTKLEPVPGVVEVIDLAHAHGCPMAVVTNAPKRNAELLLTGLGLRDRFDTFIIGEELEYGKPHPLPYLTALKKLNSGSDSAFAFEDSLSGVKSASSAGIRTFGMMTSLTEERLLTAGAFKAIHNFLDVEMRALLHPLFEDISSVSNRR